MKIIQFEIVEEEGKFVVLGLGDDSKMYFWDVNKSKWEIYGKND